MVDLIWCLGMSTQDEAMEVAQSVLALLLTVNKEGSKGKTNISSASDQGGQPNV